MERPELLMPAGSLKKLDYAYTYGADAAYIGIPLFSLRARENEFNLEQLKLAIEMAHNRGKKIYVTANIFARNRKLPAFDKQVGDWIALKPDALIMSDPGLMYSLREKHPDVPIHLSVQSNCMNWKSVKFWKESLNISRIILSRELQVNEIKEIKQRVPEIELEAFIHGAICIAYSGRCLLSSYFSFRDANQGVCDNSCREKYHVFGAHHEKTEDYFIEDLRNKGEFYRIDEDSNGTYIMNAKDLRLIEHLKEILDAGVCSLKVEGRTKTEYYLALVTRAYRQALEDLMNQKTFNPELLEELEKVANRGYHSGFMMGEPKKDGQIYRVMNKRMYTQKFAGMVQKRVLFENVPQGFTPVDVRCKIKLGDECEFIGPSMESYKIVINDLRDSKGQIVNEAHGGTGVFFIKTEGFKPHDYSMLSLIEKSPEFNNG